MSYHFFKQRRIPIPPHPPKLNFLNIQIRGKDNPTLPSLLLLPHTLYSPLLPNALNDAKTTWKYDLRSENSYQTTLI